MQQVTGSMHTPQITNLFFALLGKIPYLSRRFFISCPYRIILFHRIELPFDNVKMETDTSSLHRFFIFSQIKPYNDNFVSNPQC